MLGTLLAIPGGPSLADLSTLALSGSALKLSREAPPHMDSFLGTCAAFGAKMWSLGNFGAVHTPKLALVQKVPFWFNVREPIFSTLWCLRCVPFPKPCFYHALGFIFCGVLGFFLCVWVFCAALTPFPGLSDVLSCHEPGIICSLEASSPK